MTNAIESKIILRGAKLHWNISSIPKDGPDIHRFQQCTC